MRTTRTIMFLAFIFALPFHAIAETQNTQPALQPSVKTRDRASKAMNNLLHGPMRPYHAPSSSRECSGETAAPDQDTSSGSGKEIAKVITGVWQIATFWCSSTDASTAGNAPIKK